MNRAFPYVSSTRAFWLRFTERSVFVKPSVPLRQTRAFRRVSLNRPFRFPSVPLRLPERFGLVTWAKSVTRPHTSCRCHLPAAKSRSSRADGARAPQSFPRCFTSTGAKQRIQTCSKTKRAGAGAGAGGARHRTMTIHEEYRKEQARPTYCCITRHNYYPFYSSSTAMYLVQYIWF